MIVEVKKHITQEELDSIGNSPAGRIEMLAHNLYIDIRNKLKQDKIEPVSYKISIKAYAVKQD